MKITQLIEIFASIREQLNEEDKEQFEAALTQLSDFLSTNAEYAKSVSDLDMVAPNLDLLADSLWRIL